MVWPELILWGFLVNLHKYVYAHKNWPQTDKSSINKSCVPTTNLQSSFISLILICCLFIIAAYGCHWYGNPAPGLPIFVPPSLHLMDKNDNHQILNQKIACRPNLVLLVIILSRKYPSHMGSTEWGGGGMSGVLF